MEKAMAPHSSTLAWKIPWTEEPGVLQSMGSLRVGHDWATSLSLFPFMHWRRKWQPTPVFLPGESQGWETCWAAVYGVTQSRTRLKRLSRSSSSKLGEGHGNPLQYSCPENPHGQRSLVGYSPWGHNGSDTTEWLSTRIQCRKLFSTSVMTYLGRESKEECICVMDSLCCTPKSNTTL